MPQIIKISPKGQITLPKKVRDRLPSNQLQLTQTAQAVILEAVEIKVIAPSHPANTKDDLQNFGQAAEPAFSFLNNPEDNAAEAFYKALPDLSS